MCRKRKIKDHDDDCFAAASRISHIADGHNSICNFGRFADIANGSASNCRTGIRRVRFV